MSQVTLLTDFGHEDHYVGVMKGVISSINPNCRITDLCHNIPPGNIHKAAYQLLASYRFFPAKTIFTAVVDPGVGTSRKAILLKTPEYFFIAPDNGLLTYIFDLYPQAEIFTVTNEKYFLNPLSNTFHGRDVFAPAAAHLSTGFAFREFGPLLENPPVRIPNRKPVITEKNITGSVLDIDRFGNLVSNIPAAELAGKPLRSIMVNETEIKSLSIAYGETVPGTLLALIGSSGFLEISVNLGNARDLLNISGPEAKITCFFE